ncbi:MAG: M23 family metallopeptidase [Candidatus Doudnabacteria bacterium]
MQKQKLCFDWWINTDVLRWCLLFVTYTIFALVGLVDGQSSSIKPLQAAPDFNGTYEGSPKTGGARYTTLYRDNQDNGYISGCRGEGCGKHPGVDIAVSAGTAVYNPLPGTVMISRCDGSWGGLVVIRSVHPSRSWEYIYQVFGHLRERRYSDGREVLPGDYVGKARLIGRSGGRRSVDPCSGNSTGAHLHYQIDREDGSPEPWYPRGGVNTKDANYEVMSRTYNPMVLLQHGYKWSFDGNGNRELWDILNWQSWGVANSALWFDGRFDPGIRRGGLVNGGYTRPMSANLSAEASDFQNIILDIYSSCYGYQGKIYFITNQDSRWDETKVVSFYPGFPGAFRGRVYVGWHYKWRGVITGLRIDPAENCSASYWDPTYIGEVFLTR